MMDFEAYAKAFDDVRADFEQTVGAYGLSFEAEESSPRALRVPAAVRAGCRCENGDASLWRSWISPACLACRTGERTATFFISLRCTKNCYFCFNPNQEEYDYFLSHRRDIVAELEQAHEAGMRFDCLAVTGGEPLLHKGQLLAFVRRAKELYPGVHVRVYTSGDLLDDAALAGLAAAGLDELRFSVKPVETDGDQEPLFGRMAAAVAAVPDVMVEMPVIPGTLDEMKRLLARLDGIGVRGINLLEFCFPLHNAEAFRSRGFKLRREPYEVLYNYWYAGGLPIAGSEAEALELLRFAADEGLRLGVHYCSLDNKHTGQVHQQNMPFLADRAFAAAHAWLAPDETDRFLKCAKAFGKDAEPVRAWAERRAEGRGGRQAERAGCVEAAEPGDAEAFRGAVGIGNAHGSGDSAKPRNASASDGVGGLGNAHESVDEVVRFRYEPDIPCVSFPLSWVDDARAAFPDAELAVSLNVLEPDDVGEPYIREVDVRGL